MLYLYLDNKLIELHFRNANLIRIGCILNMKVILSLLKIGRYNFENLA